jgi:hypothetical protein
MRKINLRFVFTYSDFLHVCPKRLEAAKQCFANSLSQYGVEALVSDSSIACPLTLQHHGDTSWAVSSILRLSQVYVEVVIRYDIQYQTSS